MEYNFVQGLLTPEQALRRNLAPAAQPTEINSNQIVNQAVNQGIQQEQLENKTQQFAQQINDNNNTVAKAAQLMGLPAQQGQEFANYAMKREVIKNLLGGKQDYARAEAMGDAAGMEAAHQNNLAWQKIAEENGIDFSGFGSGNNLYEAQARYQMGNMQHLMDIDSNMDSGTYYNQLFNDYKNQGMSDKGADMYAAQKADEYQRNRIRNLKDEFYANGITPDGEINQYGERLIDMIHDESPEALTSIANRLPGYMQGYIKNVGEYQKDNALARTIKLAELNHQQDLEKLREQQAARMELAQFQVANRPQGTGSRNGGTRDGGTSGKPKLSGLDKKGYEVSSSIYQRLEDIQKNPEYVYEHEDDHRIAQCVKDANDALKSGAIDHTQHQNLMYKIRETMDRVWGADNVKKWIEDHPAKDEDY